MKKLTNYAAEQINGKRLVKLALHRLRLEQELIEHKGTYFEVWLQQQHTNVMREIRMEVGGVRK